MFFPCPHCQFLVSHHPQLRPLPAACPQCGRPLLEEADAEVAAPDSEGDDTGEGATDAASADALEACNEAVDEAPPLPVADDATTPGDAAPASPTGPVQSTAPAAFAVAPRRRWARWSWPLIPLLALLLALQILLADRARLAADPRWRPLVESLCGALRCELPAWHEPSAFTMLDRKVRPAPQPGALRVDATFRNDARWPQAWPALQLALSDADGRVLGSRVFQPAEYLGAAPSTRLSPGQSAQITFLVQEPAPGTVAFSFEFR